ncbi:MAG: hypothetical protein KC800_28860, partial [Candidatus Eremiobacteraeota bacterium]|nr:hypothetical protein [Candidatus Eremiobacteraeota bacterium]
TLPGVLLDIKLRRQFIFVIHKLLYNGKLKIEVIEFRYRRHGVVSSPRALAALRVVELAKLPWLNSLLLALWVS